LRKKLAPVQIILQCAVSLIRFERESPQVGCSGADVGVLPEARLLQAVK
jgi:hypothetical protein